MPEMPQRNGACAARRLQSAGSLGGVVAATALAVALAGCGAEVAGTAATVAATEAAQARQAQAQKAKLVDSFKQAQDAAASRAASTND
jgi:NAD(P)H-dependent FMN reductase